MEKEEDIDCLDLENDIEKRRPKPYRYVTSIDKEEISSENDREEISVMTDEKTQSEKLRESFGSIVGVGNIDAIETVLRRHEMKRGKQ